MLKSKRKNYKGFTLHLFISNTTKLSKKIKSIFNHRKGKGFTLVEILVVIAVIGLLSSLIIVTLGTARDKAKIAKGLQFEANVHHSLGVDVVGMWDFDECSQGSALDSSENDNNGTVNGAILRNSSDNSDYTPSGNGCSYEFNGTSDYIEATKTGLWSNIFLDYKDFTISAWVKPFSITHSSIVGQRYGDSMVFGLRDTGKLFLNMDDTRGNSPESTDALAIGNWYHIVVSFADYRNATFYINGSSSGSGIANDAIGPADDLFIGWQSRGDAGFPGYFNGLIDEVKIYEQALSSTQIKQIYVEGARRLGLTVE